MAFNISDFKSTVEASGFVQSNKYDVQIAIPASLAGQSFIGNGGGSSFSSTSQDLMFRSVSASLPGVTMRTTDINRYGIGVYEKMPYSANYTDTSLTFICDRYSNVYNFWYLWFNYVFGTNGNVTNSNVYGSYSTSGVGNAGRSFYTAEYKDNYSSTVTIRVYDTEGNVSMVFNLYKAYPVTINDTPLNWTDNNNMVKLTVQMTFLEWDLNNTGNGSQGITIGTPQGPQQPST